VQVKESDLQKGLSCLAKRFKLTCDSSRQSDIDLVRTVGRSFGMDSPVRKSAPGKITPFLDTTTLTCRFTFNSLLLLQVLATW